MFLRVKKHRSLLPLRFLAQRHHRDLSMPDPWGTSDGHDHASHHRSILVRVLDEHFLVSCSLMTVPQFGHVHISPEATHASRQTSPLAIQATSDASNLVWQTSQQEHNTRATLTTWSSTCCTKTCLRGRVPGSDQRFFHNLQAFTKVVTCTFQFDQLEPSILSMLGT